MNKRINAIAIITSLLLFAGQVAALVHAADHPFHTADEICVSFTSLEQNEHAVAVLSSCCANLNLTDETNTGLTRVFINHTFPSHQPRAPPLHT
jgi:hypothetical protein